MKPEYNTILDDADSANHIDFVLSPEGPEGCTTDLKWQEWSNGAKITRPPSPPNSLDQNLTPKKSLAEFPSHDSFQKAETVAKQVWLYNLVAELMRRTYAGTITNLHKYCLNQATQNTTCQNFLTQKFPNIKNFKPKKILRSSPSLEIRSNPWRPISELYTMFSAKPSSRWPKKKYTLLNGTETSLRYALISNN